jgi:hypothetical protein
MDPSALVHSLKHLQELCEYVNADERPPLMPTIKEIFDPLKYIIKRTSYPEHYERDIEKLTKRIQELIDEEI